MARNIMAALNRVPDGKHSKNAFSLSNYEDFHQKGGMINVVGFRDTVPNAEYRMGVDGITKTLLCNTHPFARVKENYYFVHVPLGLICNNAYQMLVQRRQDYSALQQDIEQFPVFNLADVVKRCLEIATTADADLDDAWKDVHGFNIAVGALRLLDMLGYGYFGDLVQAVKSEAITLTNAKSLVGTALGPDAVAGTPAVKPSVAKIGAYQCVWYNFFRNSIYDNSVDASCYNFDDCAYSPSSNANYDVTSVRGVDPFIKNCLQLRYNPYKKDLFMGAMPGTQFGAVSTVSLMDNLVTEITIPASTTTGPTTTGSTTLRNSNNSSLGYLRVLPPSEQTGEYGNLVSTYAPNFDDNVHTVFSPHTHSVGSGTSEATFTSGTSLFDVLSLVESQAIQKWRQKSMLAGNRTRDQFMAHHGVVPRHLQDHLPDFIGSVDNEIIMKEITSQANTLTDGDNNLGQIRGRGLGASDNRSFKFYSDDYGVLLLLHAIVPENTYSSYGLDKGNMMVYYSDFFQQEYENIGLETVPKILLNTLARYKFPELTHGTGQNAGFADDYDEGCVGYAPRYYNYKQVPSRVHGMFNPTRLTNLPDNTDIYGYNDMQSFVITRRDMVGRNGISAGGGLILPSITMSLSKLYVNPNVFDSIFAFDADNNEDTDAFFSHVYFYCDAYEPMSVLGLPQF